MAPVPISGAIPIAFNTGDSSIRPAWQAEPVQPTDAAWLETAVPEGLAVFKPPQEHRRRTRTSNPIERSIQQELKRRTRKIRIFPDKASLERLVSAILVEIDETRTASPQPNVNWKSADIQDAVSFGNGLCPMRDDDLRDVKPAQSLFDPALVLGVKMTGCFSWTQVIPSFQVVIVGFCGICTRLGGLAAARAPSISRRSG